MALHSVSAVGRIGRTFSNHGFRGLITKALTWLRHRIFTTSCSIWFTSHSDRDARSDDLSSTDLGIEFLDEDRSELEEWMKRHQPEFPWLFFPQEKSVADECNHVYSKITHHGLIVGYIKVGMKLVFVHDFGMSITFPQHHAFIYDTFVLPAYRGQKIAGFAVARTQAYLRQRGFNTIWCHIEAWNEPSLKLFGRNGFQERARIQFVRILNLKFFLRDRRVFSRRLEPFLNSTRP